MFFLVGLGKKCIRSPGQLYVKLVLSFQLVLTAVLPVALLNGTLSVASACALTKLLPLPVDTAEILHRFMVKSLHGKAFMTSMSSRFRS